MARARHCVCGCQQDVQHILLDCLLYRTERRSLLLTCRNCGLQSTVASLLGDDCRILNALFLFLCECGLLSKLGLYLIHDANTSSEHTIVGLHNSLVWARCPATNTNSAFSFLRFNLPAQIPRPSIPLLPSRHRVPKTFFCRLGGRS